jgi:acetyl esterase/lipase
MEDREFGRISAPADGVLEHSAVSLAPVPFDLLEHVDPELRPAAVQMRQMTQQFTPMSQEKLAMRRAMLSGLVAPLLPDVAVSERRISAGPNAPEVGLFVINAKFGARRPGILHTHGGGFTASSARGSVPHLQELSTALDCTIVTVDYRKAPETRYDGSLEDNYAALRWMHEHVEELGVDPTRIALLGESGGGGHAALLAIAARDRGEIPVLFQALIYPMIDDRTGSLRAMPPHLGAFGWNADANRFGWRCFLGQEPGTDAVPACAVPARVESVVGLPPAFIGVGALDLFVDENIAYARRLIEAGVATELIVVPGAFHGFDMMARDSAASRRFAAAKLDALRRAFATAAG